MTMLQTFTDSFEKDTLCFFSDFITDTRPFGIVKSNNATIGVPTVVHSNQNSDGLGEVTCTLGSGTFGAVYANRVGIFQAADTLGTILSRDWKISTGDHEFECRMKTDIHPSAACMATCGYILNHNSDLQSGAYFYHMNGQSTWKAAITGNYVLLAEIDTKIPVSSYSVLGVTSSKNATEFQFFANGSRVLKWVGTAIADDNAAGAYPMAHMEMRDRVAGGGGRPNSFTADYMFVRDRIIR